MPFQQETLPVPSLLQLQLCPCSSPFSPSSPSPPSLLLRSTIGIIFRFVHSPLVDLVRTENLYTRCLVYSILPFLRVFYTPAAWKMNISCDKNGRTNSLYLCERAVDLRLAYSQHNQRLGAYMSVSRRQRTNQQCLLRWHATHRSLNVSTAVEMFR
jgi:hypothetical protein